jgi:hypothetical protein
VTPEDRAWEIVRRAFEEREPRRRRSGRVALVAGVAVAAAVVAAALSPAGHAVFEQVRRAVGVEHAERALAALPGNGKLLVVSPEGGETWVVDADGAKRSLGAWQAAAWSPHGLYVAAVRSGELAALTPTGEVRWTLPRRDVSTPVWHGTMTDTRIAYFTGTQQLRVVAGDGTGDRLLDPYADEVGPAWRPGTGFELAYVGGGAGILRDADSGRILWRTPFAFAPQSLGWSTDGSLLAIAGQHRVLVLDAHGRRVRTISSLTGTIRGVAFRPRTHELAVTVWHGSTRSEVRLVNVDRPGSSRLLFAGPGRFADTAWSPTGAWLLVEWPEANQWLFVSPGARPRVRAVANVTEQFPRPDGRPPDLFVANGWCCAGQ